jgi:hypothetical protein
MCLIMVQAVVHDTINGATNLPPSWVRCPKVEPYQTPDGRCGGFGLILEAAEPGDRQPVRRRNLAAAARQAQSEGVLNDHWLRCALWMLGMGGGIEPDRVDAWQPPRDDLVGLVL